MNKLPLPVVRIFNKQQRGVALITVMLIVALAAVMATQMTARLQMQMQRSINIELNQQAYWYAMGAEAFAKRVLITAFKDEPDTVNLGQIWAQGETSYPVDYGQITGEITDLYACLNLNALRAKPQPSTSKQAPAYNVFKELIISLNIDDVSEFEAASMADALTDWLDEDSAISSLGGAEDNDYASMEFPYLPANNYLSSINELRVVAHFTVPVINALKPYVCFIPNSDALLININTISNDSPELLQALLGSTLDEATEILSARPDEGFKELNEFFTLPEMSKITLTQEIKDQFVVDSEYFKLKTTASFNKSFFALNSIMNIKDNKNITVISRTIGHN